MNTLALSRENPDPISMQDARTGSVYRSEVLETGKGVEARDAAIRLGLLVPMHGPAGMFGLSCIDSAVLAAEEINAAGGLLGRPVRLHLIDAAGGPASVAERVVPMVRSGTIDAVAGWHLSHVRRALASGLAGRTPYVYSTVYEGGETAPGVFLVGETPDRQLAPAMAWLAREAGIRRWAVVGDDYLWPRASAAVVRSFARDLELALVDQTFVSLGEVDFAGVVQQLERSSAQGVILLLVGQDAVYFNRAFARAGLHERMVRLSSLMDENMLLASGPDATAGLYSSAAYFASLATADALDLAGRYAARFGPEAPPLTSMGESCYEALRLLATLVEGAGTLEVRDLHHAAAEPIGFHGPRGSVHVDGQHLVQSMYLAEADETDFRVLTQLDRDWRS